MINDRVSEHFSWAEVETTNTGLINTIPLSLKKNATRLAKEVLEPIRILLGPLEVNSWYRSPAVNKDVGGEKTSYHLAALAADVKPRGNVFDQFKMAVTLINGIAIDQIIYEKQWNDAKQIWDEWIHVGTNKDGKGPRRMALTATIVNGEKKYEKYNVG